MKYIYFTFFLSAVLVIGACAKKEDSSSSSSSSSSTSSTTSSSSTYSRSSTPSSLSVSVPGGLSASTIKTSSSRTSGGRSADAYASSGPCQNVTQTGESEIPNNKVAVGCEKLANATELLGNSIMMGDVYLNLIDYLITNEKSFSTSSTCDDTKSIEFTSAMYESMKAMATQLGIDSSAYSDWTSKSGTKISLAYVYNTSSDSDYDYKLQVATACDNITNSSGVSTYLWNKTSNVIAVGFEDTGKNTKGVFTYNPTDNRSTYRVTEQEQVTSQSGGTDNNTNNYTVTMKNCNSTESDNTTGTCAVIKINLSITGKGVFPSGHANAGQSKTNAVVYYADGKSDDSGVYITGTYSDYTYALDNRSNMVDNHTWIYEGSWNKTGITYVKQNMDGGSFSTYPSTEPDNLTVYKQSSYSSSANTATLDNSSAVSAGSYVIVKDNSSNPNTAPETVIGVIERSHDNYTSDAWDNSSSSKLWVWDPVDKQYESDNATVTLQ